MIETSNLVIQVLAPREGDAAGALEALSRHGIPTSSCTDVADLALRLDARAGAALIAEEALDRDQLPDLHDALRRQPTWSDLPVLLLTGGGRARTGDLPLGGEDGWGGNVSIIERPVRQSTLVAMVESALRARRRQLEVRDLIAELEQFAYAASHDLQEPLRMVTMSLDLLRHRAHDRLEQREKAMLERAVAGGARMRQMIEDLLALSRIERREGRLAIVDAAVSVRTALHAIATLVAERRARIYIGELPTVRADAAQLGKVFQHLVSNAVKFTASDAPEVWIEARVDGAHARFSVRDKGIGIHPIHHDRIFEVFQRLNDPRIYAGTGIGLSMARRIVERHRGRIWCESQPGKGTTFFFTVPLP